MTTGVQLVLNKDETDCFEWYIRNKENNIYNQLSSVRNPILCPCNRILLRFDPRYAISRFDRINQLLCYATMIVGRNTVCKSITKMHVCTIKGKNKSNILL